MTCKHPPFLLRHRLALCAIGVLLAPLAQAIDTVKVTVSNDAKTVTYQLNYVSTSPEARRIWLDIDQNRLTGYSNTVSKDIGAEYALFNGTLLRYTGTGGWNWQWVEVKKVSFTDDGKRASWTVARKDLLGSTGTSPTAFDVIGALANVGTPKTVQKFTTGTIRLARNPLQWPFASNSIWNMPIGKGARYVPANLPEIPGNDPWAPMPSMDPNRIVFTPNAPLLEIKYSNVGWTKGADRCVPTGGVIETAPVPLDYVVGNSRYNNSAAILQADGRTITQVQPFTRCVAGGVATSIAAFAPVDLYGTGITGSHGGSGMSGVGGAIRLGELKPNQIGMRHALKLDVDSREVLYACKVKADCFRWPAVGADTGAVGEYGSLPRAVIPTAAMKMGALLAIPTTVNIATMGLETQPALQMAWTLQNYGAYIVDSVGGAGYFIAVEDGVNGAFDTQFQQDWGYSFEQRVRDATPWVRDMQKLMRALNVVDNNTASSIGGGGTRLQPLAPALPR